MSLEKNVYPFSMKYFSFAWPGYLQYLHFALFFSISCQTFMYDQNMFNTEWN